MSFIETKFHQKVKMRLLMEGSVFMSSVLFSLKISWSDSIPTAGTDGKNLLINRNWYESLSVEQAMGLLYHESFHVAYQHPLIGKNLQRRRHNMACDYMINLQLVQDGFELPPGGLLDHQYANMSSMQIYELLDDDDESGGGGGYDCDILEPEEGTDPEVAQAEIENILLRAAKLSKEANDKPGSIPGELQRLIDSLLSPVLPWNVILHNYMDAYAKDDYSWARPNRRYTEEYLPSMFSEAIENISVLIDASGSVSGEELSQFFTEIISIKENMNPQSFLIGSFDTRLYEAKEFTTLNSYSVEGGGGTSAYPIKKFIEEKKPNVLIVFTDMEMSFAPLEGLDFKDIFWINTGAKGVAAPMGRIIDYEN